MDDVLVVRALKFYFIAHSIQLQYAILMIHDYDDSQFRNACTARSRVLYDDLTFLCVVMEHMHANVHMYGTKFSTLVLLRIWTGSHLIYEPLVLLYLFES